MLPAVEDCSNRHVQLAGGEVAARLNRSQPRDETASGAGRHRAAGCQADAGCLATLAEASVGSVSTRARDNEPAISTSQRAMGTRAICLCCDFRHLCSTL